MLIVSKRVVIPFNEIEFSAVRATGPGGQNVNKVATAVHLRFNIEASSLPEDLKRRLLSLNDHRITKDGVIVIKAHETRSQDKNKEIALTRLRDLVKHAAVIPKKRRNTKPTRAAKIKRLEGKIRHGRIKALRGRVSDE